MSENYQMTGRQIAAARALLGKPQSELAAEANISLPTLRRMEASDGSATGLKNNVLAVRAALEAAGIQFLDSDDTAAGPGVALKA